MNQINPFFSVIVPTYNRAKFLGKMIQSVLDQQFENFELLIVDDGSKDNTSELVRSFNDKRIRYLHKENGERGAARNFAINRATGSYITFLDSDDLLKNNHLITAWEYISRHNHSIFHLGYHVVDDSGKIVYPWKKLPNPVNSKLIEGNFLSCLGVFIKREILLKDQFNEDRELAGSEDYELWLRLAARHTIYTCDAVTAMLVNHKSRSVVSFEPDKLIKRIDLLRKYLVKDEAFVTKYNLLVDKLTAYLDIYLSLHLALVPGSKSQSYKLLLKAFRQYPAVIFNKRFWVIVSKIAF